MTYSIWLGSPRGDLSYARRNRTWLPFLSKLSKPAVISLRPVGTGCILNFPPNLFTCTRTQPRLIQVIVNLLNNAAKYTEPGGETWLIAEQIGDEAVITVRDNGVGIPPEMLSRVFDMFVQVDESLHFGQGGLGIGLTSYRD